jgi:hypothetical protein
LINDLFYPEDEIKFQVGNSIAYRDYDHRKKQIDFQIALDRWINSSDNIMLDYFDTYYDKSGNNRTAKNLRAKTRVDITISEYMIPDAAFQLSDYQRRTELYLFEMCNGKDTKRILKQVHQHVRALISKTTHLKYNFDDGRPYHILFLFTLAATKKAVINRIRADKSLVEVNQYFLFQSYDKVEYPDFFSNWVTVEGECKQIDV